MTEPQALQNLPVVTSNEMTLTAKGVKEQVQLIQQVMKDVMKDGVHFGVVKGCGDKPTLLKAGAEKIAMTFRLAPTFIITKTDLSDGHREYEITCSLNHIVSGLFLGQGVGSCSTMESKYAYRKGARHCPKCKAEAIIKGKDEYGGGWVCLAKKDGCGEKFKDGDKSIEGQNNSRVANEDLADQYNTVLKMAKKRAQIDATLTATAASDIFTQDLDDEDFSDNKPTPPPIQQPQRKVDKPVESEIPFGNGSPSKPPINGNPNGSNLISEKQAGRLYAIYKNAGITPDQMKDYLMTEYGIEDSQEIKRSDYDAICTWAQGGSN